MEELIISTENFKKIVSELLEKEFRVIGIPEGKNKYQEITSGNDVSLHPEAAPTDSSFQRIFLS